MSNAHAKPKMAGVRHAAMAGSAPTQSAAIHSAPQDDAMQRRQVCEFLRAMSAELSVLAHKNGLGDLALIFESAREAAEAEAPARPRGTS